MLYPIHAALISSLTSLVLAATVAQAQWAVGAGVRTPRFSGAAIEPGTDRSLVPYRPTMLEIGVERQGRRVGVGVRLQYASSSLAFEGDEAVAAVKDALSIYGLAAEASCRLSRLGPNGVVRLFVGPLLEMWKLPDVGSHWRLGVGGAIGFEVPFGGRWSGAARLGAAVTPSSPFAREDLVAPLEPRALWRREVSALVQYRL
jgi:hypothetical protein